MNDKLVVAVLGNRNSGKSYTWNSLFGRTVKTGNKLRRLAVSKNRDVDVFLVSGSSEERRLYVGDIIGEREPRIVLCSMQYRTDVANTVDYFVENGYSLFVHWLNPGYSDPTSSEDELMLLQYLLDRNATVAIRDGKIRCDKRVRELKDFLYGWAKSRSLLRKRLIHV